MRNKDLKCRCHACKSHDIRMEQFPIDMDRPGFTCHGCFAVWTNGKDGGEYADYCRRREDNRKQTEPHYVTDVGPFVVSPSLFEDLRNSIDTLPPDGDKFSIDQVEIEMAKLCAHSHGVAQFIRRYARYTTEGRTLKIHKKGIK